MFKAKFQEKKEIINFINLKKRERNKKVKLYIFSLSPKWKWRMKSTFSRFFSWVKYVTELPKNNNNNKILPNNYQTKKSTANITPLLSFCVMLLNFMKFIFLRRGQ